MTYLKPFTRLVLIGTLYDVEDFSLSMSFSSSSGTGEALELSDEAIAAIHTFWQFPGLISRNAVLKTAKHNLIGTDGRYVFDETVLYDWDNGVQGGVVNTPAPQLSWVVSTMTERARGRGHAGRFYLPLPGGQVADDGRVSANVADQAAIGSSNLLEALAACPDFGPPVVVSNLGAGYETPITSVRVGRVLDVVRSRRAKFDEDYQSRSVDIAPPAP